MDSGRTLQRARRGAGLTQRELGSRTGVPQPAIARIESGGVVPRVDTLDRLLSGCGQGLQSTRRLGLGVDRSGIREQLRLTPGGRARLAVEEAANLDRALRAGAGRKRTS